VKQRKKQYSEREGRAQESESENAAWVKALFRDQTLWVYLGLIKNFAVQPTAVFTSTELLRVISKS
jgi:hypothetical protein